MQAARREAEAAKVTRETASTDREAVMEKLPTMAEMMRMENSEIAEAIELAGGFGSSASRLSTAWSLIPRDTADELYQPFWKAMRKLVHPLTGAKKQSDLSAWLVRQSDPARAARIICVCWLAAKGKVK